MTNTVAEFTNCPRCGSCIHKEDIQCPNCGTIFIKHQNAAV